MKKLIDAGDKAFTLLLMFLIDPFTRTCVICHRPPDKHKKSCIYGQIVREWEDGKREVEK